MMSYVNSVLVGLGNSNLPEVLLFVVGCWHNLCACVCVCVCVCVVVVVVVVTLAQGLRSWVGGPLWQFSIWFSICLPPVHPAVIGYLAFAGVQIQGVFSWNRSGAHTTCCEERSVLLWVPSPAPGALLAQLIVHGSQCLLSAQAPWLCQVRMTT